MTSGPSQPKLPNPRQTMIWSTAAWVGMAWNLSREARDKVFQIAMDDVLPDATDAEITYALGIIVGARAAAQ